MIPEDLSMLYFEEIQQYNKFVIKKILENFDSIIIVCPFLNDMHRWKL